jgi:hypothetical protein
MWRDIPLDVMQAQAVAAGLDAYFAPALRLEERHLEPRLS